MLSRTGLVHALVAGVVLFNTSSSIAGLTIDLSEQSVSGSTAIVAMYSGSLNLSSVAPAGNGDIGLAAPHLLEVNPSQGQLSLHPGLVNFYNLTAFPAFGTAGSSIYERSDYTDPGVKKYSYPSAGPAVGLLGNQLALAAGYASGTLITGTTNYLNTTYQDWGLTGGSSTLYSIDGSSETVTINVSAVPEPSTYAMALAGLGFTGYSMFRRRNRA